MPHRSKTAMLTKIPLLRPTLLVESIEDIDFAKLAARGVHHIVFDVDDTLVNKRTKAVDAGRVSALKRALAAGTIQKVYIASNARRDLTGIAALLGATIIPATLFSRKPWPHHFDKILRTVGVPARHIAIIGDRLHTDILGGNMAGLTTILVAPVRPRE